MKENGHNDGLTVRQRMLKLLSDGQLHTCAELHACLNDELGPVDNIYIHIFHIRKSLRRKGEDIINRYGSYQLVRLLASPYDGRR